MTKQPRKVWYRMQRMKQGKNAAIGRWHYVEVEGTDGRKMWSAAMAALKRSHSITPGESWGGPFRAEKTDPPTSLFKLGTFGLDVFAEGF